MGVGVGVGVGLGVRGRVGAMPGTQCSSSSRSSMCVLGMLITLAWVRVGGRLRLRLRLRVGVGIGVRVSVRVRVRVRVSLRCVDHLGAWVNLGRTQRA